jgi:FdhD protein
MAQLAEGVRPAVRHHFDGVVWHTEHAEVVAETPVTLFVNGAEYVTAALTAIDLRDWVLGFLAGDGVIARAEDLTIFRWMPDEGQLWVRVPGLQPQAPASRYLGSCCGQSRPGFFNPKSVPPLEANLTLQVHELTASFEALSLWSSHQHSGGLHVAGLARHGQLLVARADVGRHNALDKVYGAALTRPDLLRDAYIVFSGRLSAEIVWKVRTMGIEAIISNAAPTSLGIEIGRTTGVTTVGFLRGQELSVFSHPERLLLDPLP